MTPSATITASFSSTDTRTETRTATPSATLSPSYTESSTRTATRTATPTPSATLTATQTITWTPSPSVTLTLTLSPSFTTTPSFTVSPSITPTTDRFFQQESLIKVRGMYPVPFSDKLTVFFTLRVDAAVKMNIYNVAGEPIQTVELAGKANKNLLVWPGENKDGSRCATGVYILHLEAKGMDGTSEGFWERVAISR